MKILNQQIMKNNNLKKVFSLIVEHEPISRIELAAMTSLSKTTISSLVDMSGQAVNYEMVERLFADVNSGNSSNGTSSF